MGTLADSNGRKRAVLLALTFAGLSAPAAAADLRVVLEAEGGVRSDGNYEQVQQPEGGATEGEENVALAGLNLRLSYELPRWTLALGYFPSYEWLVDDAEVNGITHRLDLGLSGNLTRRLELQVRERLLQSPGLDVYSPFLPAEPMPLAPRGDQLTHSLDAGLAQTLTRRTTLLLGATHTLRTFEEEGFSDTETLAVRLGTGIEMAEDRQLDLLATAGRYEFDDRLAGDRIARQEDVQTLGVAWRQPFFRDGGFRVEAGMFAVDSTEVDETGWRGALELSRQLEVLGWSVGLRHDVSAGAGLGRTTEVDAAFAGLSASFGRRLVLGLDGSFSRHDGLESSAPEERILESAVGTARFSWGFTSVARLNGGWSQIWQESRSAPFQDLSYSRYFVGLALQLYRSGEEPQDPARQEEPEDDEPDAQ